MGERGELLISSNHPTIYFTRKADGKKISLQSNTQPSVIPPPQKHTIATHIEPPRHGKHSPPSIPCAQVLLNLYETGGSLRLASALPIGGYRISQYMTRLP